MRADMKPEQPDRIAELSRIICAEVPILIEEARDQINASIDAIMEQAQETEEGKAVLTLSISAKWDLDGQSVVVAMPVNVRHKFSRTATMDDPNQPTLPGVELTIETGGGHTAKLDAASLRKGIQAVDRALAAGLTPDDVSAAIAVAKTMKKEGGAA